MSQRKLIFCATLDVVERRWVDGLPSNFSNVMYVRRSHDLRTVLGRIDTFILRKQWHGTGCKRHGAQEFTAASQL